MWIEARTNLHDDGWEYMGANINSTEETTLKLEFIPDEGTTKKAKLLLRHPAFINFFFGNNQDVISGLTEGSEWDSFDQENIGLQKAVIVSNELQKIQDKIELSGKPSTPWHWYRFIDLNAQEICFLSVYEPTLEVSKHAH